MDYTVFARMRSGDWLRLDGESDQDFMQRTFRAVCVSESRGSAPIINDMLQPEYVACDVESGGLTLSFTSRDWMCNPQGTTHGGLLATCADMTMGILARFTRGGEVVSTADLHVNYLRPVSRSESFEIHAHVEKQGRRLIFMRAEGILLASRQTCLTAMGIFA